MRFKFESARLIHRAKIFLNYCLKPAQKESIFILSEPRVGSSLLISYLNSIPNVSFAGEVIEKHSMFGIRLRYISKQAVFRHIAYSLNYCKHTICGAKIFGSQLEERNISLLELKKHFPNARFIIIYRKNILEQFLSRKIAYMTNHWQWSEQFKLPPFVYIQPQEFERFSKRMKAIYQKLFETDWLKSCSVVVNYEDLAANPQSIFDGVIFPFLGLPSSPVSTEMRKQNTKRTEDMVMNYHEIEPLIQESLIPVLQ